jgi:uncharacterized peroxidase-related enzyme
MPRLRAIHPNEANGKAKQLLDGVQENLGMVPNLMRTMASSPAVLEAYVGFGAALAGGVLPSRLREQVALTVAQLNDCAYCQAAHTALGRATGLSDEAIRDSRRGMSPDSKTDAALRFARQVVERRGCVSDGDVARVRRAGHTDAEIAEIVANVAASLFANYFNNVAETEVDFPRVPKLDQIS